MKVARLFALALLGIPATVGAQPSRTSPARLPAAAELAPDLIAPDSGETIASAWARIQQLAGGPWLRPWPEGFLDPTAPAAGEEDWRAALAVHCR